MTVIKSLNRIATGRLKSNITFTFLLLLCALGLHGQVTVRNFGEFLIVQEGTHVYINGDLDNKAKVVNNVTRTSKVLLNNSTLELTGNITNEVDSVFASGNTSTLLFSGNTPSTIKNTSTTGANFFFNNLIINKTNASLTLENSNYIVQKKVDLIKGTIVVAASKLEFTDTSALKNEKNVGEFIYGNYLLKKNTNGGGDFTASSGLGFYLEEASGSAANNFDLYRYNATTKAGETSINLLYKIQTAENTTFKASKVGMRYRTPLLNPSVHTNENNLAIYYSLDSTNWKKLDNPTIDVSNHTITAVFPTELDLSNVWFTVANKACATPFVVKINQDKPLCEGLKSVLSASLNASSYRWSNSAKTKQIAVTTADTYTLEAVNNSGCVSTDTKTIALGAQPKVPVYLNQIWTCNNDSLQLVNNTTIKGSTPLNYVWTVDNDVFQTTQKSPKIVFSSAGVHTVKLIASTAFGCKDSTTTNFVSLALPKIITDVQSNYCEKTVNSITEASIIPAIYNGEQDNIASRRWVLKTTATDSTINTSQNLVLPNLTVGKYNFSLEVETSRGCKATLDSSFIYRETPTANFTVLDSCVNKALGIKEVLPATGVTYDWYIDDEFKTSDSTKIIVPDDSVHQLSLVVKTAYACKDSISKSFTGKPNPTINISINDTCVGLPLTITNNSNISTGNISYLWKLQNTFLSAVKAPKIVLDSAKTYALSLEVSSDFGCRTVFNKNIQGFEVPVAGLVATDECEGEKTLFTNTSRSSSPLTYTFLLGDEVVKNDFQNNYLFKKDGVQTSQLIVETVNGCADTATVIHQVFPLPKFSLTRATTCIDTLEVVSPLVRADLSYLWSTIPVATAERVVFKSGGNFSLTLKDTNSCTYKQNFKVTLNVTNERVKVMNDTTVCDSLRIDAQNYNSTYLWSTGETTSAIKITNDATVNVKVTDPYGCEFVDTILVAVDSTPSLVIAPLFKGCGEEEIVLRAALNFGDIRWSTGEQGVNEIMVNTAQQIHLAATSPAGNCTAYDTSQVAYYTYPLVKLAPDTSVCDTILLSPKVVADSVFWNTGLDTEITVTTTSSNILTAINGGVCVSKDTIDIEVITTPKHPIETRYNTCEGTPLTIDLGLAEKHLWSTGETTRQVVFTEGDTLTATSSNKQCAVKDTFYVTFAPAPVVAFGNDTATCGIGSYQLSFSSSGFTNKWYSKKRGFFSIAPSIKIMDSDEYWLVAEDNSACEVSDTIKIEVLQDIQAAFLASSVAEVNDSVQFVSVNELPATSYTWDFGNGFTSNLKNPINTFFLPREYEVKLIVALGTCTDTVSRKIQVYPEGESPIDLFIKELTAVIIKDSKVFPNPFQDYLKVEILLSEEGEITLYLFNALGIQVFQKNYKAKDLKEEIDTQELTTGSYTLFVLAGKQREAINLVKE